MENNISDDYQGGQLTDNTDENTPLPKLYSDSAIMGFAVFFSTFFASFLMIENLKQANAQKGIIPVILFSAVFTIAGIFIVSYLPAKANSLSLPLNLLGGAILNFYFWKKYIPAELEYEKKKIWKPLFIGFILLLILLAFALYTLEFPPAQK